VLILGFFTVINDIYKLFQFYLYIYMSFVRSASGTIRKKKRNPLTQRLTQRLTGMSLNKKIKEVHALTLRNSNTSNWPILQPTEEDCSIDFMAAEDESREYSISSESAIDSYENKNKDIPNYHLPEPSCKQVVFGLNEDLARYYEHNQKNKEKRSEGKEIEFGDFIILCVKDWTIELNQLFLSCAQKNMLKNMCSGLPPIRILQPKNPETLIKIINDENKFVKRITVAEFQSIYKSLFNLNYNKLKKNELFETNDDYTYDILFMYPEEDSYVGGKHKTRKHKTRKHKARKNKARKHKTRKHKARKHKARRVHK